MLGVPAVLAVGRKDEMLAARGVIGSSTLIGSMCHSPYAISRLHVHADSSAVVAAQERQGGRGGIHPHVFAAARGGSHGVRRVPSAWRKRILRGRLLLSART